MRTMATLMMSAAEPWIGALTAFRSAKARTVALLEAMSGRYRLRPRTVSAYPVSRTRSTQSAVKALS